MSSPILQVCCLIPEPQTKPFKSATTQLLTADRYSVTIVLTVEALLKVIKENPQTQDCLVLWGEPEIISQKLENLEIFLPIVAITPAIASIPQAQAEKQKAIIRLLPEHLADLPMSIDEAIAKFLQLPTPNPKEANFEQQMSQEEYEHFNAITIQQQHLSKKLKERLGYLGVYYKRDPRQFFRHLSDEDKQIALERLRQIYRTIVLEYFKDKPDNLNQKIDEFVNLAFFGDLSVSQVLEIHMNLMDEFAKQLKLEGRSVDVLLDYRITLIDIIAHLCEMYRRSIPREA